MGRVARQRIGGFALAGAMLALTLFAVVGASALDVSTPERAGGKRGALKPFASCDQLRRQYLRHPRALRTGVFEGLALADGAEAMAPGAAAPTADSDGGEAPSSGSTNVQEAGVDEPDIVKARGSTVYAIANGRLYAVDVGGESPAVVGSLRLPDGSRRGAYGEDAELLLHGDRALVLSTTYSEYAAGDLSTATLLTEVAIGDPANMRVERTALAEGSYVSARLTGATARVVVSTPPPVRVADRGRGRALVPRLRLRDRVARERTDGKLVGCSEVRRPARFAGADLLTVLTVDMQTGLPAVDTDAVMTAGDVVYGSPTSLYVATERWFGDNPAATDLSEVSTRVHRFVASQPGVTEYVASGQVPGFMLSQWSMSEHDGVLRVASTTAPPWREDGQAERSQSFLTTLAVDGDRLREVGQVGGLGRGEQIYAVRMMGDRGYVVTFRQVDPLYVLDLADAASPRVLGELKIPGYSAYLHPVGEGFLLGIGQDATGRGMTTGVQASLFDVRDPANPARLDRESFGRYTYSEVEYDHHAFSFFPEHGLAVIPLEGYTPREDFYGAAGLKVDPAAADPLGRVAKISHGSDSGDIIRRSLLLGDRVYTVSGAGVAAHEPLALGLLGFAPFRGD
ncbi:MAG TPA: beta-propeller domain-containing protein [Solirubrobacterales bacterium]|nr:beta-propeller domain-containing protein [Solirubrobacterales bacterium]